jgi:prepilin-type N-terminal cleavage/methylation domain-containing protein
VSFVFFVDHRRETETQLHPPTAPPNYPAKETIHMRIERRKQLRRGFTLLEVLLVLAIIGVIAAFAVPQLLGTQQKANVDATRIHIRDFENHLQRDGGRNADPARH